MVVWLRQGQGAVGVKSGVVRRETLARLTELDDALLQAREDCEAQLEDARRIAATLVEDTRARVEELLADAQRRFEQSARLGYAAGRQRALDEWHAAAAQGMVDGREAFARMHDRLARLVVQAVEQVIATEDRQALYRRVAGLLERAIADSSFMTIAVSEDEAEGARAAFAQIAGDAGWRLPVEVVGDERLPPGSCLCEWDYGTLDASLDKQLVAIRRAVRRGVERLTGVAGAAGSPEDAGYDDADCEDEASGYQDPVDAESEYEPSENEEYEYEASGYEGEAADGEGGYAHGYDEQDYDEGDRS